jgi:hypothetical protein
MPIAQYLVKVLIKKNFGESAMICAIGDFNQQCTLRINYFADLRGQFQASDGLKKNAEKRKIEATDNSMQSNTYRQYKRISKKNVFEDGKLVVETYDDDGKLIRKTPPGFIPFNQEVNSIYT